MQGNIPNSDWKHFKRLHAFALERLCERILDEMCDAAKDVTKTYHERYLTVFRAIKQYDKKIESGFDTLSRSRMIDQLAMMKSLHLIEESEFENFTQETKDQLNLYISI